MAGSLRYFAYETDNTVAWNVNIDEGMGEQVQLGFNPNPSPAATAAGRIISASKARGLISMRYANCEGIDQHDRVVKRKVYVGNIGAAIWQNPTAPGNVPTLRDFSQPTTAANLRDVKVTSLVGEKRRFIPAGDTGITDGDVEIYPS